MIIYLEEKEPTGNKMDFCVPGCKYLVNGKCQCVGFCILDDDE